MRDRVFVQAFPKPRWVEKVSCDGKPCGKGRGGCAGSSDPPKGETCQSGSCGDAGSCELADVLASLARAHPGLLEVEVADYASLASIRRSLRELNGILERNGETPFLTLDNFEMAFSQISPFVALDGELAFVGKTPSEAELLEAIRFSRQGVEVDS